MPITATSLEVTRDQQQQREWEEPNPASWLVLAVLVLMLGKYLWEWRRPWRRR